MFRRLLVGVAMVVGVFGMQVSARALSIAPPTLDVRVEPGQQSSTTIVLANDKDVPDTFSVSLRSVAFAADGSLVFSEESPSWISLDVARIDVAPHGAAEVAVLLRPSVDTDAGSYVVAILAQSTSASQRDIRLAAAYSSLLFATVGAPPLPEARCDGGTIEQSSGRKVALSIDLTNSGGGILYTEASLEASHVLGSRTFAATGGEIHRVLSGQTRTLIWEVSVPWWMFGSITFVPSGLSCGAMATVIAPSISLVGAAFVVVIAALAFVLLWRARRG